MRKGYPALFADCLATDSNRIFPCLPEKKKMATVFYLKDFFIAWCPQRMYSFQAVSLPADESGKPACQFQLLMRCTIFASPG
jgi:hypothetical protein